MKEFTVRFINEGPTQFISTALIFLTIRGAMSMWKEPPSIKGWAIFIIACLLSALLAAVKFPDEKETKKDKE